MENRAVLFGYLRRAALPAVCILLIGYFVSHAINGPTGVIAWKDYKAQRVELETQALASTEATAALKRQVDLLDPRRVDPDLADELVRRNLNVVKPDEVIVKLPDDVVVKPSDDVFVKSDDKP
ncbi:MAG: FtsB family cell division protein [Polymorphobacter sp.]